MGVKKIMPEAVKIPDGVSYLNKMKVRRIRREMEIEMMATLRRSGLPMVIGKRA